MLIRHRLILWFVFFVTLVLLSFSFYIYFTYAGYRATSFQQRLDRRVVGTQQLFDPNGSLKGSINTVLYEQTDMVFSGKDSLYYSNTQHFDFYPTPAFLDSVRHAGKLFFSYPSPEHERHKDGVAMAYPVSFEPDSAKDYVAIITAYDTEGYQRQESLRDLFIFTNIICILFVGVFAHFFSIRALYPLNTLIDQIKGRFNNTLSFRLQHFNPRDEVGSLAASFNELLDQHERLIANQRAFISQASHELRTPMATLKGLLETALYYDDDKEALRLSQKKAIQELDRLISLSNGLLLLARIENEEDYINTHKVDLMELLMDCTEQVQQAWPDRSLLLTFSDGVTLQNRPLMIPGETSLLQAAITNLIDNACKYSSDREVHVSLEMNTETKLRLRIRDHGIGIPKQELEHILEPLYRASNAGSRQGFGIGLTLAWKVIRLHRGAMSIQSDLGKGTEVIIDFLFPPTR